MNRAEDDELNYLRHEAAYRLRRISIFTFGMNSVSFSLCILYLLWAFQNNFRRKGSDGWEAYKYFLFHAFNMINLAAIVFNVIGQFKANSKFIVAYIYANSSFLVLAIFFLLAIFLLAISCANQSRVKTFHNCFGFGYYLMGVIIWNLIATASIALEYARLVRVNREIRNECNRILMAKFPTVSNKSEFSQSARRAMVNEMTAADFAGKIHHLDFGEESASSVKTIRSDEPMNEAMNRRHSYAPRYTGIARSKTQSRRNSIRETVNSISRKSLRPQKNKSKVPVKISSPVQIDFTKIDEPDSPLVALLVSNQPSDPLRPSQSSPPKSLVGSPIKPKVVNLFSETSENQKISSPKRLSSTLPRLTPQTPPNSPLKSPSDKKTIAQSKSNLPSLADSKNLSDQILSGLTQVRYGPKISKHKSLEYQSISIKSKTLSGLQKNSLSIRSPSAATNLPGLDPLIHKGQTTISKSAGLSKKSFALKTLSPQSSPTLSESRAIKSPKSPILNYLSPTKNIPSKKSS